MPGGYRAIVLNGNLCDHSTSLECTTRDESQGVEVRIITPDGSTIIATPVKPLDIAPTDTASRNEWDTVQ